MRSLLVIACLAAAVALGACGGGDDSKQNAAPPRSSTTTTSTTTSTERESERMGRNRSRRRGGSPARSHPSRATKLTGIGRAIYHESRARCQALPLNVAALRYRAKSRRPEDVAKAYAARTYPSKSLQKPASEGCLAALSGKP